MVELGEAGDGLSLPDTQGIVGNWEHRGAPHHSPHNHVSPLPDTLGNHRVTIPVHLEFGWWTTALVVLWCCLPESTSVVSISILWELVFGLVLLINRFLLYIWLLYVFSFHSCAMHSSWSVRGVERWLLCCSLTSLFMTHDMFQNDLICNYIAWKQVLQLLAYLFPILWYSVSRNLPWTASALYYFLIPIVFMRTCFLFESNDMIEKLLLDLLLLLSGINWHLK